MSEQDSFSEDEQFICFNPSSLGPLNQLSPKHWSTITRWLELIEAEAQEALYQFKYGHVIGPFSTPNPGVEADTRVSSPVALEEFIAKNNLQPPVALNPAGPTICMYNAGGRKICGKVFSAKSSYWRHLYGVHTGAAMPHWRRKSILPQEYRLEAFRAELLFILQGRWPKVTDLFLDDIPVVDQCTLRLAAEICLGVQKHSPDWASKHSPVLCRTKPAIRPPSPIIPTPPRKRKHRLNAVQPVTLRLALPKEGISLPAGPSRIQTETGPEEVDHEGQSGGVSTPGSNHNQSGNVQGIPEEVVVDVESSSEHDLHEDQSLHCRGQQAEDDAENLESMCEGTQGMDSVQTAKGKRIKPNTKPTRFSVRTQSKQLGGKDQPYTPNDQTQSGPSQKRRRPRRIAGNQDKP